MAVYLMKSLNLDVIIAKINGKVLAGIENLVINDLVTRTIGLKCGGILFDIYHDKITNPNIYDKYKSCAVVTDVPDNFLGLGENVTVIHVSDINEATWSFIEFYRSLFKIPLIGVTGTCGKTTTKEMIKHILSEKFKVCATYKSNNSAYRNLGYLLSLEDNIEAAVFEMGVAYPEDLKTTCRYFKPQVGVITNIGIDHFQGCKTLESYIKAKSEFLEGLDFKGTLILNEDDENIKKIDLKNYKGNIIYYGFSENSQFKASDITYVKGGLKFKLKYLDSIHHIFIPLHGEFNVYNATAAIAAANTVGVDIKIAAERLGSFQNVEKHFEFKQGINGSTVIDDTWSTNPTSSEAALKLLKTVSQGKKTIAVLGKMALLGKESSKYHLSIGGKVAELGIDKLVVSGSEADELGHGALQKGMNAEDVYFCKDIDETYEILKKSLDSNTIVLVKTSMLSSYSDLIDKIILEK